MGRDFRVGEWLVQPDLNLISRAGKDTAIEPRVVAVLVYLAEHPGEVLSREKILRAVWADTFVTDEVLTYSVSEIRKAFQDDAKNPTVIQTIPRKGYRLIAPVTWTGQESMPTQQDAQAAEPPGAPMVSTRRRVWMIIGLTIPTLAILVIFVYLGLHPSPAPSKAPEGSIVVAVLPFENLAGNPEQEYFSDGMTEELITQLGRLQPERLRVIARTSAMQYKNTGKTIGQIGRELGVAYILEGAVRREENRVRVSTQLIRVQDQTQLWTESYDREMSGIITVQNEVAKAVATQIRITLSDTEKLRLASPRQVVPAAHEAYLRGRFFLYKRTPQALQKSVEYFMAATQEDPSYAPSFAGLADAYILLNEYADMSPKEASAGAKQAASKALELDPLLAEAHASMAMIQYSGDWDWAAAEKTFRHAISLNPNYSTAHHWYGNLLSAQGRFDEAKTEMEKAIQLDTLSLIPRTALAWRVYASMRRYDLAEQEVRRVLELDPQYVAAHSRLGMIYILAGRKAEGLSEIEKWVPDTESGSLILADLGYVYAATGKKAEARKIIGRLEHLSRTGYGDAARMALIYTGLGETDSALSLLEKALERRDVGLLVIKADPRYDPLRSQPRFKTILRTMKLSD